MVVTFFWRAVYNVWTGGPWSLVSGWTMRRTIRVAIGLRLGIALTVQHNCQHGGQTMDVSGTHGLSCRQSEGHLL